MQPQACIGTIFFRSRLDQVEQNIARLENACVIGKQNEEQPYQIAFEIMPPLSRRLQRIMQCAHNFGRLDICRVLIDEFAGLNAANEIKALNMIM